MAAIFVPVEHEIVLKINQVRPGTRPVFSALRALQMCRSPGARLAPAPLHPVVPPGPSLSAPQPLQKFQSDGGTRTSV